MSLFSTTLYPRFGVAHLRAQHGRRWADLIDQINTLPQSDDRVIALTLTLRRLRRSLKLDSALGRSPLMALDAVQILAAFGGSEDELLEMYHRSLQDVRAAAQAMGFRSRHPAVAVA